MALSVDCSKVRPEEACTHVIRADSEAELLQKVAEHAKTHNLEPTPELVAQVRQHIQRTYHTRGRLAGLGGTRATSGTGRYIETRS